jgi:hypothetical protein
MSLYNFAGERANEVSRSAVEIVRPGNNKIRKRILEIEDGPSGFTEVARPRNYLLQMRIISPR